MFVCRGGLGLPHVLWKSADMEVVLVVPLQGMALAVYGIEGLEMLQLSDMELFKIFQLQCGPPLTYPSHIWTRS